MKNLIFGVVLALAACKIDHTRPIEKERLGFAVADDAELFFKNVRQIYYDVETLPAAKVTVFRHPDRAPDAQQPALWPAIVLSTVEDEAKILIENNAPLDNEMALRVAITQNSQVTEVTLSTRGRDQMLEFATTIYKAIQAQASFAILVGSEPHPWLTNEDQREAFRVTLADFYRLTGTL